MAYRTLTAKYEKIRQMIKSPLVSGKFQDEEEDLEDIHPTEKSEWSYSLTDIEKDVSEIKKRLVHLKHLHDEHTTIRFGSNYSTEEQQIDIETRSIKDLFQRCVDNVQDLGSDQIHNQKDRILTNMKSKFVNQLNELSKNFKESQRIYIQKLRTIKEKKKQLGVSYEDSDLEPEERKKLEDLQDKIYSQGFDDSQMAQVLKNQRDIIERDRELQNILTSIVELKDMFQEMNDLIIEQGTLLDRIDYNLDNTEVNVIEGKENLIQAEKYQGCSRLTLCLLFLVVVFIGIAVIIGIKIGVKVIKPF